MADYDDYQRQLEYEREREESEYQYRLEQEERLLQMEREREEERLREEASVREEAVLADEQTRLNDQHWSASSDANRGGLSDIGDKGDNGDNYRDREQRGLGDRRWFNRWLWSRRVREDDARHRRLDEARVSGADATQGRSERRPGFIAPLAIAVALLAVGGLGYRYWVVGADGPTAPRYQLPGAEVSPGVIELDSTAVASGATESGVASPESTVSAEAEFQSFDTASPELRLEDLERRFVDLSARTQNLVADAQADRAAGDERWQNLDESLRDTREELTRLIGRLDAQEHGLTQARERQRSQNAGVMDKVDVLNGRVEQLEAWNRNGTTGRPPRSLPFQLVAIDFLAGNHYATVATGAGLERAASRERLGDWIVQSIEPELARVVFERDGKRLAQTVTGE